jgi:hypothetical protein
MKPGEGLAQVLGKAENSGVDKFNSLRVALSGLAKFADASLCGWDATERVNPILGSRLFFEQKFKNPLQKRVNKITITSNEGWRHERC